MKSIMFKTKIFHEGKMYLLVSDVSQRKGTTFPFLL